MGLIGLATENATKKAVTALQTLQNRSTETDGAESAERNARALTEIFSHVVTFNNMNSLGSDFCSRLELSDRLIGPV